MRYICRATGKRLIFTDKAKYEAHLEKLRKEGILVRDRSRRARPDIARDDAWRAKHDLLSVPAKRFNAEAWPSCSTLPRRKFSLIYPSRGRPAPARQCIYRWFDLFSGLNDLEIILSLDCGDAKKYLKVLLELQGSVPLFMVTGHNKNVVDAMNRGAKLATGDVLIYVSDDFECSSNWDLDISVAVGKKKDWFLHVHDGLQDRIATLLIVSRDYYERLGYLYYPKYHSMWGDNDATEVARKLGKYIDATQSLMFKHNHHTIGGLPVDATTVRHENPKVWAEGEALFNERKARGFDL